jgi:exodeoxyribonuclease III
MKLKASQDKFPKGPIRDAGYRAIMHGQKSWNGVAILALEQTPLKQGAACRAIPSRQSRNQ